MNTGVMVSDGASFRKWLARLDNNNAQGGYYMTNVIGLANQDGFKVVAVQAKDFMEVEGVNNRLQLANLERHYQRKQVEKNCYLQVLLSLILHVLICVVN